MPVIHDVGLLLTKWTHSCLSRGKFPPFVRWTFDQNTTLSCDAPWSFSTKTDLPRQVVYVKPSLYYRIHVNNTQLLHLYSNACFKKVAIIVKLEAILFMPFRWSKSHGITHLLLHKSHVVLAGQLAPVSPRPARDRRYLGDSIDGGV